jgi:hypothetical protein
MGDSAAYRRHRLRHRKRLADCGIYKLRMTANSFLIHPAGQVVSLEADKIASLLWIE